ncbi:hypothetical protein [Streptomyces sp. DSM 40750]|uniref:hypothetical protein n=1 Tax=Streptomyces sp. DSM 40750 TaxID=2801030 RepID=UPI00214C729A|nr:hypothetical protein [Streptomyces sp. DSM 40750]UUU23018.1 hypothetical protein JIX55_23515 [Streptomyces sp. DSM 40750]
MKTFAKKAFVVTALAGTMAFGAAGIAAAANVGDTVTGRGNASQEGVAYANALTEARNQCPNRNDVSLVDRSTWRESNGTWSAQIRLRCN